MKHALVLLIAVCGLMSLFVSETYAWTSDEHRQLGDSIYSDAIAMYGADLSIKLENTLGLSFGRLCARCAKDDMNQSRFHNRGKTIGQQLANLTPNDIDKAWTRITSWADAPLDTALLAVLPDLSSENVVKTYLLYHLMALRMADDRRENELNGSVVFEKALVLEAVAQGYLADAFSAGHILTPVSDPFAFLHPRNTIETHNRFCNEGVYVIDSRGHVWQTFGDRLLQWYAPTYDRVFWAGFTAMAELLAVYSYSGKGPVSTDLNSYLAEKTFSDNIEDVIELWLESRPGVDYYSLQAMPSLTLIPIPVSASWSFRTQQTDEFGIRQRYHYPQLYDLGLHDVDIENIDMPFLYKRACLPEWMVAPPFLESVPVSPESLIKSDPDWASVRWIQNRSSRPSSKGFLLHIGCQALSTDQRYQASGMLGIGYGVLDDMLIIKAVSADIFLMPSAYESDRLILAPTAGFDIPLPPIAMLSGVRVEGGGAIGLRTPHSHSGGLFALGIDSRVFSLGFTNIGIVCRLKYQWVSLEKTFSGPAFEMIFQ